MSNPFLSNISFSPVPFSFRQGGKDAKWGIWFAPEDGVELLISPRRLCESLDENGLFSHFFLPEKMDGSETPLVENIFIEDPAGVAETYIWEIRENEFFGVSFTFVWEEYILGVLNALQALYRHVAIDGNETAYYCDAEDFARDLLHARGTAVEYLFDDIRKPTFQKALKVPIEPFHAKMVPGLRMNLGIGGRELTLSLIDIEPDQFRHELEHLVFHDETSLSLDELGKLVETGGLCRVETTGWKFSIERVRPVYELEEDSTLLVSLIPYEGQKKQIVGFCREKEVLSALCGVFMERYPKSSIGHALKRHLSEL